MSHHISDIFSVAKGKQRLFIGLMWKEITINFNQYFCKYLQPGKDVHITIHAKVVYAIMLDFGIPKTTLLVILTKCHVPWQSPVLLPLFWPGIEAQSCWCKLSSTPLLAQTCPSLSPLYYTLPQKIRNVCSQILLFLHMFSHMPQKKGMWKYIWGPNYVRVLQ